MDKDVDRHYFLGGMLVFLSYWKMHSVGNHAVGHGHVRMSLLFGQGCTKRCLEEACSFTYNCSVAIGMTRRRFARFKSEIDLVFSGSTKSSSGVPVFFSRWMDQTRKNNTYLPTHSFIHKPQRRTTAAEVGLL
jgi:hypothetical protein